MLPLRTFLPLAALVLCSCSATNLLTITVTEPAPVSLPADVDAVGIVDRSVVEENRALDVIEKVLTAEDKDLDRDGAQAAIGGLAEELALDERLADVRRIAEPGLGARGVQNAFPPPLDWATVERLCAGHGVDALFELSFYDTDHRVTYETVPVEVAGPLGIRIPGVEHRATVATDLRLGWRLYHPASRMLLDEMPAGDALLAVGAGINPMRAVEAITGRKDAVLASSRELGRAEAWRLLPFDIRVSRHYYVRGTDGFRVAMRRARTGDWEGAAALWEMDLGHPRRKVAGRAAYNMAIIHEIRGDLEGAVDWASRAYTDHRNRLALRYLGILRDRQVKRAVLEGQAR